MSALPDSRYMLRTWSVLSATSKQCFELPSLVLSASSKQGFELSVASFLIYSLIFIKYKRAKKMKLPVRNGTWSPADWHEKGYTTAIYHLLTVPRSSYYWQVKEAVPDSEVEEKVKRLRNIFYFCHVLNDLSVFSWEMISKPFVSMKTAVLKTSVTTR